MYDRRSRSTCTGLFHSSSSSPRGFTRFTKRPGVRRIFDKLKKKSTTKGGKKVPRKEGRGTTYSLPDFAQDLAFCTRFQASSIFLNVSNNKFYFENARYVLEIEYSQYWFDNVWIPLI